MVCDAAFVQRFPPAGGGALSVVAKNRAGGWRRAKASASQGWLTRKKRCGASVVVATTCQKDPFPVKLV